MVVILNPLFEIKKTLDQNINLKEKKSKKSDITNENTKIEILKYCQRTQRFAERDSEEYNREKAKKLDLKIVGERRVETSEKLDGEKKCRALVEALNKFDKVEDGKKKRSNGQRLMHKAFLGACLKKIYGEDLYKNLAQLTREYELDELRQEVIVTTPRRMGKTYATAMFAAAALYALPKIEIAIYSPGRRASKKMLKLIKSLVIVLTGTESSIINDNEEELCVRGLFGDSKCFSYPSKVEIWLFFNIRKKNLLYSSSDSVSLDFFVYQKRRRRRHF